MNLKAFGSRETGGASVDDGERDALSSVFRRSMFWTPERQASSAWIEHVPFAFWLVDVLRPRKIVELGTYNGVSYSAMCQAVKTLGMATSCFAIDTWKGDENAGFYGENIYRDFAAFHDQRYGTFSRLVRSTFDDAVDHFQDGSIDLLHIDGLHTYKAVRHDYQSWLPKLSRRAIVLFHDTNVRERGFGVYRLWAELAERYPRFEFVHGHGLGVLGVGPALDQPVRELLAAADDAALTYAIRSAFWRLGSAVRTELYLKASGEERARLETLLSATITESEIEVSRLTAKLEHLRLALEEKQRQAAELIAQCAAERSEKAELGMALAEARSEGAQLNTALDRSLSERASEIKALREAVGAGENELAALKEVMSEREARIAALHQSMSERADEIKALREAVGEREAQVSALYAKISALHISSSWRITAPLRAARRLLRRLYYSRLGYPLALACRALATRSRAPLRQLRAIQTIARSDLFDRAWYLKTNPDVMDSGIDPVCHYVAYGAREQRDPSPCFNTVGYLAQNADVAAADINPLAHFLLYGAAEGRTPSVLHDTTLTGGRTLGATRHKETEGLSDRITVLTTKHTLFVGHLIDKCLSQEGYLVSVLHRYDPSLDDHGTYIVVCPQMFAELPRKFVAFQMEQSTSSRWFDDRYRTILTNAVAVLDYSLMNIAYLQKCGIPHARVFYVPISPLPGYLSYLISRGYKPDLSARRTKKVLFYGDANCVRRREFLEKLRERFEIQVVSEVYGQDLINEIIGARVVVNVHYYESALLETTRISEALSLGVPVVSEESVDIAQYEELRNVVEFTRTGDAQAMIMAVERLLSDGPLYQRRIEQIDSFVNGTFRFSDYLKRFLVAQGAFSFERFVETSTLLPRALPSAPRICLSVPENTARRSAFDQRQQDFLLFDGVRYHPGWVGCGMSYKYIFSKLLDTKCPRVTICEDDVFFDERFQERFDAAIRFLDSTKHPWDIFAGLIADVHPDVRILRVVMFDGEEYIFLNRMTSMVFNIYNRSSFGELATWDETNCNVQLNTIDRYIESSSNVVTVTTLPFLVGHDEELSSSIWHFDNSQYRMMLDKSRKLLQTKVNEFKRHQIGALTG